MQICFMGTSIFAVKVLQKLLDNNQPVSCVYTKAPKRQGRGSQITPQEVHTLAIKHNIEVRTPHNLRDPEDQAQFINSNFDLAIVASYGIILPEIILKAPKYGCINVHASLLPKWRGASPIQMALINDEITGITIMQMDKGLDTGDILLKASLKINKNSTFTSLSQELGELGSELILKTLALIKTNKLVNLPQNNGLATYAKMLTKEQGKIDFNENCEIIEKKIRAFQPFPSTYINYNQEIIKILGAQALVQDSKEYIDIRSYTGLDKTIKNGTILNTNPLVVKCGEGLLKITRLQRQGKQALEVKEFLKGFIFKKNDIMG
ncbi:Methionyl-tRNA formyltransferase [Candidatus Hepatincolaceae symbiont of Richtersius coronifer]